MDGGERRQSQYGGPYQPSGSGRASVSSQMGPPSQEQYSQPTPSPARGAMVPHPSGRPYMAEHGYTYPQTQFQSQLQYSPSYVQDPSRTHQLQSTSAQHQYGYYGQGNILPPVGQQSIYEQIPNYQHQRQSTAIEVMAGQFGGGGLQYVPQGEPSTGVGVAQPPSQYLSSQPEQQSFGSMSFARPPLQSPFTPTADYSILEQAIPQQSQEETSTRQATEDGKRQYEEHLRSTFDAITTGRVSDASERLLTATEWLVGAVRALGLHHDDEDEHNQRISLWRELNHAWEALGQKQKSITENAIRTRQQPADFLTSAAIRNLIEKLINWCDQLERYGLVDYEMGLWEEQIVDVFVQCLDLLSDEQTNTRSSSNGR